MFINIALMVFIITVLVTKLKMLVIDTSFNNKLFIILFTLEHFVITIIFAFFLDHFSSINDPQRFYRIAIESASWFPLFGFGNTFMSFLVYPFAKIGVSLVSLFFLFSLIGWIGFLIFFKALDFSQQKRISVFYLLFLIPSIHLWTSSLSKEPLLLFFISVIIYQVKIKSFVNLKTLSCLIMVLFIRPHVFFILGVVLAVIFIFNEKKIMLKQKLNVFIGFLVTMFVGLYFSIVYFLKLENFNFEYFKYRYQLFVELHSNSGNTGISLMDTNIFQRIVYLMYMPLPLVYNTENFFQFYISIENVIYVLFSLYVLLLFLIKKLKPIQWSNDIIFSLSVSLLLIILFGSYLYNYGLGNRMRIMFYPTLFYVLIKIEQQRVFTR